MKSQFFENRLVYFAEVPGQRGGAEVAKKAPERKETDSGDRFKRADEAAGMILGEIFRLAREMPEGEEKNKALEKAQAFRSKREEMRGQFESGAIEEKDILDFRTELSDVIFDLAMDSGKPIRIEKSDFLRSQPGQADWRMLLEYRGAHKVRSYNVQFPNGYVAGPSIMPFFGSMGSAMKLVDRGGKRDLGYVIPVQKGGDITFTFRATEEFKQLNKDVEKQVAISVDGGSVKIEFKKPGTDEPEEAEDTEDPSQAEKADDQLELAESELVEGSEEWEKFVKEQEAASAGKVEKFVKLVDATKAIQRIEQLIRSGKKVAIVLSAENGCPACKMVKPFWQKMAAEKSDLTFVQLDPWAIETIEDSLGAELGVEISGDVPQIIIFKGKRVMKHDATSGEAIASRKVGESMIIDKDRTYSNLQGRIG